MKNNTKGIAYACLTALFWGFLAIFLKFADQKVDSVTIVWFRFLVAFIVLSGWKLYENPSSFKILVKPPLILVIAAVALLWNYIGFMLGVHYTTPSNAQLFIQLGPILFALAGVLIFKEKLSVKQLIGFGIAIIGFVFFYRDQLSAFFDSAGEYKLGILIIISGALLWSVYAVLQKKLVANYSATDLNLFIFGLPVLLLLPFIKLESLCGLNFGWWMLMIFLGLNTVIAYTSVAYALKYTEAHKVSIILILNPMITLATMGILLKLNVSWIQHEKFSIVTIIGAILVFIGAIFVTIKGKRS
jgi:drug/metabolite transporter (DMT)-like permease